jgi:uncharacterized protein (TIGR03435 family)
VRCPPGFRRGLLGSLKAIHRDHGTFYGAASYAQKMKFAQGTIALILASALFAAESKPEFEVASIRPSAPLVPGELGIGLHIDGAQVRCKYFSLSDYLGIAYKLKNYQIAGPDWIKSERFDINGKLPEGANREQVPEMLKALLESRFQLKMHHESRPLPVYALIQTKGGIKLKELPPDPVETADAEKAGGFDVNAAGSRNGVSINLGRGSSFSIGNNKLEAKKLTMTGLADMLARFEDRPVLDMTQLTGKYDCTLEIQPEDFRAMTIRSAIAAGVQLPPEALRLLDNASDSSLHSALESVGLKLEPRKAPIDVLVVDQAAKAPTEN